MMEDKRMNLLQEVQAVDREVADAITAEMERQNSHIELIASENWVSPAVMEAMGSILTNKYAEGYPGKRYYGGCECVDIVENLAIERAKELFGCEYVNVQPHSGAQANMAVQFAMLTPDVYKRQVMSSAIRQKYTRLVLAQSRVYFYRMIGRMPVHRKNL